MYLSSDKKTANFLSDLMPQACSRKIFDESRIIKNQLNHMTYFTKSQKFENEGTHYGLFLVILGHNL